jgi:cation transport ATPase
VCLVGHLSHLFAAKAPWIHAFHSVGFHISLCLLTLLGPGRQLILDGLKSLFKRAPNMNSLVGLGALSSFTVSSFAVLLPKLVKCIFEICYLQLVILNLFSCWLHFVTHLKKNKINVGKLVVRLVFCNSVKLKRLKKVQNLNSLG